MNNGVKKKEAYSRLDMIKLEIPVTKSPPQKFNGSSYLFSPKKNALMFIGGKWWLGCIDGRDSKLSLENPSHGNRRLEKLMVIEWNGDLNEENHLWVLGPEMRCGSPIASSHSQKNILKTYELTKSIFQLVHGDKSLEDYYATN